MLAPLTRSNETFFTRGLLLNVFALIETSIISVLIVDKKQYRDNTPEKEKEFEICDVYGGRNIEDVILLHISPMPFFLAFDYSLRDAIGNDKWKEWKWNNGKNSITYLALFGRRREKLTPS